jgi:hypothetical protein
MATISRLVNVSWAESEKSGLPHYTSSLNQVPAIRASNGNLILRPYSKVRFILVPAEDEIRFTPLLQFSLNAKSRFEDIEFDDPRIQSMWLKMHAPRDEPDSSYAEGLLRLVTAFACTAAGTIVLRDLSDKLAREYPVLSAELLTSDMQFVLGEHNAGILRALAQSFPHGCHSIPAESAVAASPEPPNNVALCKKIGAKMRQDKRLTATSSDHPWESVGKVFLGLRGATDSLELRKRDPSTRRMKVGLNYSSIKSILADEFGIEISPEEVEMTFLHQPRSCWLVAQDIGAQSANSPQ